MKLFLGSMEIAGLDVEIVPTALIIVGVIGMVVLSRLGTRTNTNWYRELRKPHWQPSPKVFGPVWGVIYTLFALSTIIVWNSTSGNLRGTLMLLYALNGVLNVSWSFIFFEARSPVLAGLDITGLWVTIAWIMIRVWPVSELASLLLLPYFAWVGFATVLNWTISGMNE